MSRTVTAILVGALLVLVVLYGREQKRLGESEARELALRAQVTNAAHRVASAESLYRPMVRRAERAEARAQALIVSRGRAVVATDSNLVRVDSVLSALPDTLKPVLESLVASIRVERAASDSAISSLSSALALKNLALSRCDSVIASLHAQIAAEQALNSELTRRANPSLLSRSLTFARHAAVGAGVALMLVLRR